MPKALNPVLGKFKPSPFSELTLRAKAKGAVNLGQGFPDHPPPEFVDNVLANMASFSQQYAPIAGDMQLRTALAADAAERLGLHYHPETEITILAGATEAMQAAILGILAPNDEVIVFEPYFEIYVPQIYLAGAKPVFVPLHYASGSWNFDPEELASAINSNTKAIILNTPHNPLGKVFSASETEFIAHLALKHDLYVIADEVYDRLTYHVPHVSIATLPHMQERTIVVGSAGKTFAVTGWRVGWTLSSTALTAAVRGIRQWGSFCAPTPLQQAVAVCFGHIAGTPYNQQLQNDYRPKGEFLAKVLNSVGLPATMPEGGYFISAEVASLAENDILANNRLLDEAGVIGVPMRVFYDSGEPSVPMLRFAFCKTWDTLEQAAERLQKFFGV